jgi:hypothetical protein
VTDPEHPELLRFLDGPPNTWTIQVQVADGTMITALEHLPPGLMIGDPQAEPKDGFLIWDVHEPDRPKLLGQWASGAAGTHRNFYNGGQRVYATSTLPGFEGHVLAMVDIADPANPRKPRPPEGLRRPELLREGGRFGPHNQHQQQGLNCLAPNDRYVYIAYFNAGLQIYDVSDPATPAPWGTTSPTTPKSAAGRCPPSSSTRPRTSWSTAAG